MHVLTSMLCMCYNACIMTFNLSQITVRGLDDKTKQALVKKASRKGMSLNKYALESLRQAAGTNGSKERYQELKQFFSKNGISKNDAKTIDDAVAWFNQASLKKQKRDS